MRWRWLRLVVLATLLLAAHPSTALATSSLTASEVGYSYDYVAEDVLAAHGHGAGRLRDRPVESRARGDSRAGEVRLRPAAASSAPNGTGLADEIVYPPNRGFHGDPIDETLDRGVVIDRYDSRYGTFVSPQGTSFPQRAGLQLIRGRHPTSSAEVG